MTEQPVPISVFRHADDAEELQVALDLLIFEMKSIQYLGAKHFYPLFFVAFSTHFFLQIFFYTFFNSRMYMLSKIPYRAYIMLLLSLSEQITSIYTNILPLAYKEHFFNEIWVIFSANFSIQK